MSARLCLLVAIALCGCARENSVEFPVEVIEPGPVALSIEAEGELRSTKATALTVPGANWAPRQLTWMKPEGSPVAAGEVIARFTAAKGKLDLAKARLDLERNALAHAAKAGELESIEQRAGADLAQVGVDLTIAERYAGAELDMFARNQILDAIQDVGFLGTKREFLEWKRHQASERGQAELAVLDSQRATYALNATTRESDLAALELKAPHDGVLVLAADWSGERPKIGTVMWAGSEFGSLPDSASMEVQIALTQLEAQGIRPGALVELAPVGRPELTAHSEVGWVASAAQARNRQNPVKYLLVKVPVPADAVRSLQLVPGQSMRARLFSRKAERGLTVPNVALESENGKATVRVRDGSRFVAREVELGERGSARSEIVRGLERGDVVLLVPKAGKERT